MAMSPVTEVLLQLFAAVIVVFISRAIFLLYWPRRSLPPGPFPLPVLGNILAFGGNVFPFEVMNNLSEKYGSVFTVFMGTQPFVVITDPKVGIPALKKHTFAGRPHFYLNEWFFKDGSIDIILADFGKEWEALRKVGHTAARKFASSPRLAPIVIETVDRLIEKVGDQPFGSTHHISLMMNAILAQAAFGKKYDLDDPEFQSGTRWSIVSVNTTT